MGEVSSILQSAGQFFSHNLQEVPTIQCMVSIRLCMDSFQESLQLIARIIVPAADSSSK